MERNSANIQISESISTFKLFLDNPVFNNLQDILNFLKKIPVFIVDFIKAVDAFCTVMNPSRQQYFRIIVYLTQYCSAYELYKNNRIHQPLEKEFFCEIQRCVCKRLRSLLDNADLILFEDNGECAVGSFINLLDIALDKIAEIDIKKNKVLVQSDLNATEIVIEEILCLSMSIAQVAYSEDNKIITAGCRSVLNALESLKSEISQENLNIAMCNLMIDTCTDALCALEARVNTAVLRLCLNVFSEYKEPIQHLYNPCKVLVKPDVDEELMPLVAEFDLHMDRIFQISLFSVASSSIGKRVADIKNIIANLEFLEGELVPAILAMTRDQLLYRKLFGNALKKSWCAQVKLLRRAVHGIIEPSAYCKLIYEYLKQNVEAMWQHIKAGKKLEKNMLDPIFNYTEELGQMITVCLDSFNSEMEINIKTQLLVVYNVMRELKAAKDLLLSDDSEESNAASSNKVFKRCQILVTSIKKLWLSTIEDEDQKNQINSDKDKDKTVTNFQTFVKSSNQDNPILENIITKSKQLVKDRSMCTFNQTNILNRTLKDNGVQGLNKQKLSCLPKKANNSRDYSYRQHEQLTEERYDNVSVMEKLLPQMEKTFYNSKF